MEEFFLSLHSFIFGALFSHYLFESNNFTASPCSFSHSPQHFRKKHARPHKMSEDSNHDLWAAAFRSMKVKVSVAKWY
jgi:hypothetical protein